MRFKVGDKVRVREDLEVDKEYGEQTFVEPMEKTKGKVVVIDEVWNSGYAVEIDSELWLFTNEMLEPVKDPLMAKVMERNNKPTFKEQIAEANRLADAIEPAHYRNGDKDLFDEWHERYYHSEKTYTGREVFVEIMKSVAERYARRYPNKNEEDLEKAVYTLERLKEYEESEE